MSDLNASVYPLGILPVKRGDELQPIDTITDTDGQAHDCTFNAETYFVHLLEPFSRFSTT